MQCRVLGAGNVFAQLLMDVSIRIRNRRDRKVGDSFTSSFLNESLFQLPYSACMRWRHAISEFGYSIQVLRVIRLFSIEAAATADSVRI